MWNRIRWALCPIVLVGAFFMSMEAAWGQFFLDDFEDGSLTDGAPASWVSTQWFFPGTHAIENGTLLITPGRSAIIGMSGVEVSGHTYGDVSLRMRIPTDPNSVQAMFAGKNGDFSNGYLMANYQYSGAGTIRLAYVGDQSLSVEYETGWIAEDAHLQLDIIGQEVFLSGWLHGSTPPDSPQLHLTIPDGPVAGTVGLIGASLADDPRSVAFYEFQVSAIPEPSTALLASLGLVGLLAASVRRKRRR